MTASIDLASLRERVRDALDWPMIAQHDALVIRKSGREQWSACCPFHIEKTPSFTMGGRFRDRYMCFGCGEKGDFFDYWGKRRSLDHVEAVKELAGLAGVSVGEIHYERPKAGVQRTPEKRLDAGDGEHKKPSLPSLYKLNRASCEMIASTRGLDFEAVWMAARVYRRLAYSPWPLYQRRRSGRWLPKCAAHGYNCELNEEHCEPLASHPSWAAVDGTLNVAEFRRLDNQRYERMDGTLIKTWSTAGKSWPLGAADIGDKKRVLLVEGGPDMLAAYHFLSMWRMLDKVAVVCMLGAGNRIREDALPFFAGCRVRIMIDADKPKDSPEKHKRKLVGAEAGRRWSAQLTEAGAAVEVFYVGDIYDPDDVARWHEGEIQAADVKVETPGFVKPDGTVTKDLNELALCADDVVRSDDVRQAMTAWDF